MSVIKVEEMKQMLLDKEFTKQVLENLYLLGGKSGLFNYNELVELLKLQGFKTVAKGLNELEQYKLIDFKTINRQKYVFFTNRTIKQVTGTNTSINTPESLFSYNLWHLKYDYIKMSADIKHRLPSEHIKIISDSTVFNTDNNKKAHLVDKFGLKTEDMDSYFKFFQNFNICFGNYNQKNDYCVYLIFMVSKNNVESTKNLKKHFEHIIDKMNSFTYEVSKSDKTKTQIKFIIPKEEQAKWEKFKEIELQTKLDLYEMSKNLFEFRYV